MSLYATAVKKPVTTALVFVAIVIFGLFSLTRLSVDLLPEIETNTIMVMTSYAGASAADIEMNVSKPLENVLNSVSDLKHITSQSRENISIITLEFDYGTDIDVATNDVRDKLDVAEPMLPDDVDNPIIFKFGTNDIPIIILSVTAEESTNALYKILDDKVSNPLARISGVGAVSISGTPTREIQVYCDPYKLEAYGVSIEGISAIIAQENRNTPGGSVDIGSNAYALRVQGEFTDAHQMDDLVIGHKDNKTIYLRDVARIEDSIEERAQETYNNGKKGGMIVIQKQSGKSRKTKCDGREKRNVIFEAKTKCAQKSRLLPLSSQNTSVVQTPFESCLNDAFLLNFLLKYHLKPIANLAKNRIFT